MTVEDYLAHQTGWQKTYLTRLRNLIHMADPHITEHIKWRAPFFEHNGTVAWMFEAKDWVNFSIDTTHLQDFSTDIFDETTNERVRTIRLREGQEIPEEAIISLIRHIVAANTDIIKSWKKPKQSSPK